ncbi:hypothetical protein [Vibrio sp. THAF190c]|uniref:hypothetical protein n=1 Tax=Vibrio sp. THAF190c TaxID=2587865 RepID=UPI0015623BDA|nr:hypothetical protein [Vibrio sp. THAF190c]
MNDRELQRLTIIQDVAHHNLSRRDALKLLDLSNGSLLVSFNKAQLLSRMEIEANRLQIVSMKASSCKH